MKTDSEKTFAQSLLGLHPKGIEVSREELRKAEFQTMIQLDLVKVWGQETENCFLTLTAKGLLYSCLANFDHHGEIRLTAEERDRTEIEQLVVRAIAVQTDEFSSLDFVVLKLNEPWMILKLIIEYFPHKYTRAQLFYEICRGYGLASPLPALKSLVVGGFVRTFMDNDQLYIELI